MHLRRASNVVVLTLLVSVAPAARALPPNFLDAPVASGWNQAVGITFAADGRMFVWEKGGRVWNVENGQRNAQPLIDISEEVGDWRDFGLLGFAIDPNFNSNGYIYLLYVVDYHHLRYFGTPTYNPNTNEYFHDTIGRLTRYTCNAADGFRSTNYASRLVLIGESITTGFPVCHQSHAVGTVLFGEDGTLLASCGDGASYETVDVGGPTSGSSNTALADGIITQKEDVGSYRAQLVDSLSGKVVRVDPANGNGLPSNPFFDAAAPRAPRSRMWAMGLRNPFRMGLRPGTGNPNPGVGDPGTLYIGNVGWNSWEELEVSKGPSANFGWPAFEGMEVRADYYNSNVPNRDAPNPLFNISGCTQQFFYFRNLIVQDTLGAASWPNPCNAAQQVPASIPRFEHTRPAIDWGHGSGPARARTYVGNNAAVINVGAAGSPVAGPQFGGNCSTGGVWYTGADFPIEYRNSYFHAEFGGGWIRQFLFDANDDPTEIRDFELAAGGVVGLATNPVTGGLYYVGFDQLGQSVVHEIRWVDNLPPIARAGATPFYGPAPLTVQFSGAGSSDPENQALTYRWDFGDGSPVSSEANPTHVYGGSEDITALGTIVAQVFSLNPPNPIGGGNWNAEIIRDGDYPPVGNDDSQRQYDTYHAGDQGNLDWIGYSFAQTRTFEEIVFQEGKHFPDGGWFDTLRVQTRTSAITGWSDVTGLVATPIYPGNNGVSFETFRLRFTPRAGRYIRILGEPGGSANFISVGELRVIAQRATPLTAPTRFDATLTVTDTLNSSSSATVLISVNNTPPLVNITSPVNGSLYSLNGQTIVPLTATISDAEHGPAQLTCSWVTYLHHNEHVHGEPADSACATETVISPVGCYGDTYFYEARLTVTDAAGLSTSASSFIFPDCSTGCTSILRGDANCDGRVDNFDIDPFVLALVDEDEYRHHFPTCNRICACDVDQSGALDNFDIDPFVICVTASGCP